MTLEELNLTCDRLEAAQACRNLAGKLSYYSSAFRAKDILELWDHSADAALELPEGNYKGYDQTAAALKEICGERSDPGMDVALKGVLRIHNVNTDLLEINASCNAAHGVWYSPGLETDLYDPSAPDQKPNKTDTEALAASADYIWRVYAISFVKTEGVWKIQKLSIKTVFDTPFDTPWSSCKNTLWAADRIAPAL